MLRKIRMIAFEKAKNNIDQRIALSHAGVTLLVLLLAFCPVLHQGGLIALIGIPCLLENG